MTFPPNTEEIDRWNDDSEGGVSQPNWNYWIRCVDVVGNDNQYAEMMTPQAFMVEPGDYWLGPIGDVSFVCRIANTTNNYVKAAVWLTEVIEPSQAYKDLAENFGADIAGGLDYWSTFLYIQALSGTDAGKACRLGFDLGTRHPASDFMALGGGPTLSWETQAGDLVVNLTDPTKIKFANTGMYAVNFMPSLEYFYP